MTNSSVESDTEYSWCTKNDFHPEKQQKAAICEAFAGSEQIILQLVARTNRSGRSCRFECGFPGAHFVCTWCHFNRVLFDRWFSLFLQDYIDHALSLEDRYLRTYGEVLTFGSGDCGQLAHGSENFEDLEVKYPRIVYSLRDKKIMGIACGGIHNAAYTSTGQVYTWGCADDGALGRTGDENMPLLVDVSAVQGVSCRC